MVSTQMPYKGLYKQTGGRTSLRLCPHKELNSTATAKAGRPTLSKQSSATLRYLVGGIGLSGRTQTWIG